MINSKKLLLVICISIITFAGCSNKEEVEVTKVERELQNDTNAIALQKKEKEDLEKAVLERRRTLCSTNDRKTVEELQQALRARNYNPRGVDGIYGVNTINALTAFQVDKNLLRGNLTLETLDALGVTCYEIVK